MTPQGKTGASTANVDGARAAIEHDIDDICEVLVEVTVLAAKAPHGDGQALYRRDGDGAGTAIELQRTPP